MREMSNRMFNQTQTQTHPYCCAVEETVILIALFAVFACTLVACATQRVYVTHPRSRIMVVRGTPCSIPEPVVQATVVEETQSSPDGQTTSIRV